MKPRPKGNDSARTWTFYFIIGSGSAQAIQLGLKPLWAARVADYLVANHQLTVADLTNRKTDEANHNARRLEEIVTQFRAAREKLLKHVAKRRSSSRPNMGVAQPRPVVRRLLQGNEKIKSLIIRQDKYFRRRY